MDDNLIGEYSFLFERLGKNQRAIIDVLRRYPDGLLGSRVRKLARLKASQASVAYRGLEDRGLLVREHREKPPFCVYVRLSEVALIYFGEGRI